MCFTPLPADFKDNLNKVYEAIEESDFLAIDGEFSGTVALLCDCELLAVPVWGPGARARSCNTFQCQLEKAKATSKDLTASYVWNSKGLSKSRCHTHAASTPFMQGSIYLTC